jgi:hypothetical protein
MGSIDAPAFNHAVSVKAAREGRSEQDVIPAKAGTHLDLVRLNSKQNGFPLSRE